NRPSMVGRQDRDYVLSRGAGYRARHAGGDGSPPKRRLLVYDGRLELFLAIPKKLADTTARTFWPKTRANASAGTDGLVPLAKGAAIAHREAALATAPCHRSSAHNCRCCRSRWCAHFVSGWRCSCCASILQHEDRRRAVRRARIDGRDLRAVNALRCG